MGELFEELCKGPVVVIDDMIGKDEDRINELIKEIQKHNLPILKFDSIKKVRQELLGLCFSNFIVLDWKMIGGVEGMPEVQLGSTAEEMAEQEVMELIKEFQKICLAPIFVVSAYNKGDIIAKLQDAGLVKEGKNFVFVENKDVLCGEGALISKIEDWINDNPHIYLAKCWTNEWLLKNTKVFWDLYELNPDWPTLFYHSFEEDGEDPILALRDTFFQLVFSEIDVSGVEPSRLDRIVDGKDKGSQNESLKELYRRLVYSYNNIDNDIRPGDIFRKDGSYYLNIRPECDTTSRVDPDPKIYLLKGDIKTAADVNYESPYGIIEKENQIVLLFLDGNDIVVFDKRKLSIKKYSQIKNHKICRVTFPFITLIKQSYSSYLGRFGVPSYPKQIVDSLFEAEERSSED